MSMLKEFRDFAVKGNVIDLAVGIIIGAAFGKIVDSLVNDLVMPAINAVLGGAVDFSNQYVVLSGSVPPGTPLAAARTSAVVLAWGRFINACITFVIQAIAVFVIIKVMNAARRRKERDASAGVSKAPEMTTEERLLGEIRDLLKHGPHHPHLPQHPTDAS